MRQKDKIFAIPQNSDFDISTDSKILASFNKSQRNFLLDPFPQIVNKGVEIEKLWLVIKGLRDSEYLLSEGDVVRLGKVKLKIVEINGFRNIQRKHNYVHSKIINQGGIGVQSRKKLGKSIPVNVEVHEEKGESVNCRICLSDDPNELNHLISPCLCAGTMGVIHIECLRKWLASKITHNVHNNINSYTWKSLECELCKYKYPNKVLINDALFDLITITKPEKNFVVIDVLGEGSNHYFVIPFEGKENIKLGRGNDSDLRLADISVSRNHAVIKIKNCGLFLEDLDSKFGSLVKIKKDICLDHEIKFQVQCGRSLLKISIDRPWSFFGCFSGCSKGRDSDEDIQKYVRDLTQETIPK